MNKTIRKFRGKGNGAGMLAVFIFLILGMYNARARDRPPGTAFYFPLSRVKFYSAEHDVLRRRSHNAISLLKSYPDSAAVLLLPLLPLSEKLCDDPAQLDILAALSKYYEQKIDYDRAIAYQKQAINIAHDRLHIPAMDRIAQLCGLYLQRGDYEHVINMCRDQAFPASDSFYRAVVYVFAGKAYVSIGNMDSASALFFKAIRQWPMVQSENVYHLCAAYSGLSEIANNFKHTDKALMYIDTAIGLAVRYRDSGAIVNLVASKSAVYAADKKFDDAIRVASFGLSYGRRRGDYDIISLNAYNIACALIEKGDYREALHYAQACYGAAPFTQAFWIRINANYIMGYIYTMQKQYEQARGYLAAGIQMAKEKNHMRSIADAYSILATAYAGMGQFDSAYRYRSLFSRLRDSLTGYDNASKVAQVESRYQMAVKDRKLAEQKVEIQQKESRLREKNFWIGGITGSALLLGLLLLTFYRGREKQQAAQVQQVLKQREIDMLKAKMEAEEEERGRVGRELHDGIVSQLMSIKFNINALQDAEHPSLESVSLNRIAHQLDEATLELRATAHNLMPDAIQHASLESAVRRFCEQIQRFSKMEVCFETYGPDTVMDGDKKLSLYRIVQELIHNVVKHSCATLLLVQISHHATSIAITIEDNGIGLGNGFAFSQGSGLQNVKKRIAALEGILDVKSETGQATTFYMEFEFSKLL